MSDDTGMCSATYALWYTCVACFFFFQAEDGIRDLTVTGVQTCALPIYIDPATPCGRRERELRQLPLLGALPDVVRERLVRRDVTQEHLPLDLESVVEPSLVGNVLPLGVVVAGARHVGVPHGPWCLVAALYLADAQAGNGTPGRAVHLELQQVVTVDARRPRGIELRDDVAVGTRQHERGVRGVVRGGGVAPAALVHPFGDVGGGGALHGLHRAERVVEQIAPVGEHVDDDAAAVLRAVVPRRALRRRVLPLEHPVPELAAHAQDAAEEATVHQPLQLADAGEEELVLHYAVLHAALPGSTGEVERLGQRARQRLFAVHLLPARDRPPHVVCAEARHRRIAVVRIRRVREARIEIGRDARDTVRAGDVRELRLVPTHQDRVRDHPPAVGQRHPALLPDGEDGPNQVLIQAHASRHAAHDDSTASDGRTG